MLFCRLKKRALEMKLSGGDIFAAVCAAFVIASIVFSLGGSFISLSYVARYPVWIPILITVLASATLLLATLALKTKSLIAWVLLLSSLFLSVTLVAAFPENVFFCLGMAVVLVLVAKYVTDVDKLCLSRVRLTDIHSLGLTAVLVASFTVAVYIFTAAKYKSFYHSTFDFGIFCQMFENMAKTGIPYTTVERSELLSHFAVHFSPFFYLLLPGYYVWRSPLYLLFCQALGVSLGAFAVRRICRRLGLSPGMALGAAAVYLLFPTMANGCFYDFHENKFLAVLILWAVAFVLDKNRIGICVFSFLILTVKEDAFIYVLAICLWMLVTKRERVLSLIIAAFSVGWFFFACGMIELSGGEIMTGRFSNYSKTADGGLFDAVRTCFVDIGYLFKEVFAGADTESFREMTYSGQKLEFVLWTAAPLLFTPFLRKRPSELVLLLPLLVINLMPRWLYQYNVDFQYTYGTCALMIFAALLFLGEHSEKTRYFSVVSMLCLCTVFSSALFLPKAENYRERYYGDKERYKETEAALEEIPSDSSVTAYGYVMPHLWYIEDLHTCPEYYAPYEKTDYYVIDTRYESDGHTAKMYSAMGDDYRLVCEKGYVKIYRLCE